MSPMSKIGIGCGVALIAIVGTAILTTPEITPLTEKDMRQYAVAYEIGKMCNNVGDFVPEWKMNDISYIMSKHKGISDELNLRIRQDELANAKKYMTGYLLSGMTMEDVCHMTFSK